MTDLAVIVPTLNERNNVESVVLRLSSCLAGMEWEVVFVDDDSSDGTAEECRRLARINPRVRVVQRIGRRGLASACIEGMLASSAPYIAVMDGDLQHDERILPQMLQAARCEAADVVVGSRNLEPGGMGEFAHARVRLSQLGRQLSSVVTAQHLSDPMSGFFLITRAFLEKVVHRLQGIGFKILLDLVSSSPEPVKVVEIPYVFRQRETGESKLDFTVGFEYVILLVGKLLGYTFPTAFASFAFVGCIGLLIYWSVLTASMRMGMLPFSRAAVFATLAAMISNFLLNNLLTHRTHRIKGYAAISGALLLFIAACSIGALANIAVARLLLARHVPWFWSGTLGIVIGSVWNYSVTSAFIWHVGQRQSRHRALLDYQRSVLIGADAGQSA